MTQQLWSDVDRYINGLFIPPDAVLDAALEASDAAGLPQIAVTQSQGKLLNLLARMSGAKSILEIGTLGGYSTIWLARAVQPMGGNVVTLEYEPKHAEVARENLKRAGVADIVEIRVGPAVETLPKLLAEGRGPFDFIFIDADKENYPEYLAWSLKLSRAGTVLVADNLVRKGEIINPDSPDPRVQGARQFNELLAKEPRVDATLIQTVGLKGYDGLAIGIVKTT